MPILLKLYTVFGHGLKMRLRFGYNPTLCYNDNPQMIYEPVHEISNNAVCATSKASDQPAHTRSLIRAFASRLSILWLLSY